VAPFSQQALGQVVRRLREEAGKTQAELGAEAGYGAGAGVSISRLENGQLLPGPAKLAGIARALGLTLEQLEAQAAEHTAAVASAPPPPAGAPGTWPDGASAPPGQKELNRRSEAVTSETAERAQRITELSEAYNVQYDRARELFLLPFDELGARLDGAPRPDPAHLQDEDDVAAGPVGASTDGGAPARRALPGAAAVGALASGRAGTVGIAGLALAGIALMPAAALLGGGLVWKVRRDRKQRQELAAQLAEAEAALTATRPGIVALEAALPRATSTLDYIATHAGHALRRWAAQLDPGSKSWASLSPADQQRYQELFDVATAQITIATFDFQGLLTTTGRDRERLIQLADQVLTQAQDTVQAHV
jgi:transcriptional regulator with XRE-family HTH domain